MFRLRSANASAVHDVVMAAEAASATASTKAARRRVRQRLHKKLASVLSHDEMEEVMDQFKADTKKVECQTHNGHAPAQNLTQCAVYYSSLPTLLPVPIMQLPLMIPIVSKPVADLSQAPMVSSFSMALQSGLETNINAESFGHISTMSTTSIVEHEDDNAETEIYEGMSRQTTLQDEWPVELPVERTFIHFRLESSFGSRRRSASV